MEFDPGLCKALAEAQRHLKELSAPQNEANTCAWVIRPLLLALGYAHHEIDEQASDISNRFPDFTIQPNSPSTWYLEAKAWTSSLKSPHVDQALYYAHSNGKRWVVLSNGREWRLYDDHIKGVSDDRLVATASLDNQTEILRFLAALSKSPVFDHKVSDFAAEKRIKEYIYQEVKNPKSQVITAIVKAVKNAMPGVNVSGDALVSILNSQTFQSTGPAPSPTPPIPAEKTQGSLESPLIEDKEVFICTGPDADAQGSFQNGGILVLKGSLIRKTPVATAPASFAKEISKLLESGSIADEGQSYKLLEDKFFDSPSSAAMFVLARTANGWISWKLPDGTLLDQFRKK